MLIHGIRYLLVAKQIMQSNSFCEVDFSVANSYYYEIMKVDENELEDCKKRFM